MPDEFVDITLNLPINARKKLYGPVRCPCEAINTGIIATYDDHRIVVDREAECLYKRVYFVCTWQAMD